MLNCLYILMVVVFILKMAVYTLCLYRLISVCLELWLPAMCFVIVFAYRKCPR